MWLSSPECNGSVFISRPLSVSRCNAYLILLINVNHVYLLRVFVWNYCVILLSISFLIKCTDCFHRKEWPSTFLNSYFLLESVSCYP
jgi:hypothetical protein